MPTEKYHHLGHKPKLENLTCYASNLRTLPYTEGAQEPDASLGWSIQELGCSDLYPDFSKGFHDKNAHDSTAYLLPSSSCHDLVPYSFGSDVPDQSLVPYTGFRSPVEKFNSKLTSWDVKEREDEQSHLPLVLYNPSRFHDEVEELGGDVFFGLPPRKKASVLDSSASYGYDREDVFSHISDEGFSFNEQSVLLVNANSENNTFGFSCDLPLLDPPHSLGGSDSCAYRKYTYDPFLIDN
jgi:hypothetical protein